MSKKPRKKLSFGKYEKAETQPQLSPLAAATTFSFQMICTDQHGVAHCSFEQMKSLLDKLRILCNLTWGQIDSSPRNTSGYEPMPRGALKRDVPRAVPADRTIIVFRFGKGKAEGRMVGFREGQSFYLLFIDSAFDLYDHG